MGQAKRRGTLQQRRWLAIEKKRKDREALALMQIEAEAKRLDAEEPKRRATSAVLAMALGIALTSTDPHNNINPRSPKP